jgi:hypothetical protein
MGMAEYLNKEMFLASMGLVGDETKYGNRDSEHQGRSYGTWMGYEIMYSIDDCVEEDVVKVVRCKDCVNYKETLGKDSGKPCGYGSCNNPCAMTGIVYDEDFCSYGERRTDDST